MTVQGRAQFRWILGGKTQPEYNGYASQKIATLRQSAGWYPGFGLHACADAVNTGLLNTAEKNAIFAQQFTNRVNRGSFSG